MTIEAAARATRRYEVRPDGSIGDTSRFDVAPPGSAAWRRDRLNLAAVLEALREEMVSELQLAALKDDGTLQHAMHRFDALLAETKETTDA